MTLTPGAPRLSEPDTWAVDRYLRALPGADAAALAHFDELEQRFVTAAGSFSQRYGISYDAWRDVGVELEVLHRAGLADRDVTASRHRCAARRARPAAH
jgi:hypothetical protein